MTRPTGVIGVLSTAVGCWIGWLGADSVFCLWLLGLVVDLGHQNWGANGLIMVLLLGLVVDLGHLHWGANGLIMILLPGWYWT